MSGIKSALCQRYVAQLNSKVRTSLSFIFWPPGDASGLAGAVVVLQERLEPRQGLDPLLHPSLRSHPGQL